MQVGKVHFVHRGAALTICSITDYSPAELDSHQRILASQLGNLLSRISSPKLQKRFLKAVEEATSTIIAPADEDKKLIDLLTNVKQRVEDRLDRLEISRALEEAMDLVFEVR
jgi:methionyl-tRNA synthetase